MSTAKQLIEQRLHESSWDDVVDQLDEIAIGLNKIAKYKSVAKDLPSLVDALSSKDKAKAKQALTVLLPILQNASSILQAAEDLYTVAVSES